MVYEHLLRCFILKDPFFEFLQLFQVVVAVAHGDILRLVALMLGGKQIVGNGKGHWRSLSYCHRRGVSLIY